MEEVATWVESNEIQKLVINARLKADQIKAMKKNLPENVEVSLIRFKF